MRKKIFENISKIGQNRPFWRISAWPAQASWVAGKKICQKVGQTCQQSSGVNKFHFYQKTFVSISHMLITEVSGFLLYMGQRTLKKGSGLRICIRYINCAARSLMYSKCYYFLNINSIYFEYKISYLFPW